MNKEELKNKFKEYVLAFDMNETAIVRKYYHSLRVMDLAILIAKNTDFKYKCDLVAVSGLLHDYARFTQWKKYKTYSDIDSIDHGDLGVELLFNNEEIKKFYLNENHYEKIYDAIKYHNKLEVPNELSEPNKLLCNIIRDADKLDIYYLFSINKELNLEDDKNVSLEVEKQFFNNKSIDYKMIKNNSDKILLNLAFVYDLNIDYSYKYLREKKLIEKIYEGIEQKEKFKKYFDYVNKYIDERIEKLC